LGTDVAYVINLQISTDNNGNAVAVWQVVTYDSAYHSSIYANHLSAGVWGTAQKINTGSGFADLPQVSMDNNGNAIAVWQQIDSSGHNRIYANRYSAGAWGMSKLLDTATGEAASPQIAHGQPRQCHSGLGTEFK
jgi:hypothetical protein